MDWQTLLTQTQASGSRALKAELDSQWDTAFQLYVSAAQSYLHLIRTAPDTCNVASLKQVSSKLLDRAQRIKAAHPTLVRPVLRDRLAQHEQYLVLEQSSRFNQLVVNRWPLDDGGDSGPPTEIAHAIGAPTTSTPASLTWVSASNLINTKRAVFSNDDELRATDLVQRGVSDCSVIAALAVLVDYDKRCNENVHAQCLYPKDMTTRQPIRSPSGLYSARLLLNGDFRKIVINDELPLLESEFMCAASRRQPTMWISLLEKAYLCAMGGWDFAGSALIGWIPESIHIGDSNFQCERVWDRVLRGFQSGTCLVTAGTAADTHLRLSKLGLIPFHAYAILDVREDERGVRTFKLYNTWDRRASSTQHADQQKSLLQGQDGTFELGYNEFRRLYDTLHLSWKPSLFEFSQTIHSSTQPLPAFALRFGPAPLSDCEKEVWILLTRHRSDRRTDQDVFMALHVLPDDGDGLLEARTADATASTDFSNSTQLLARFRPIQPQASYTLLFSHRSTDTTQPLSSSKESSLVTRFSLTVYSVCPFKLLDAGPTTLPFKCTLSGEWKDGTSGGHHGLATFMNNPMWSIQVVKTGQIRIQLVALKTQTGTAPSGEGEEDIDTEKSVNVKIVRSEGDGRVTNVQYRDVVGDSGAYTHGLAQVRVARLQPGLYTIVASTFASGYQGYGSFDMKVEHEFGFESGVKSVPAEGAGMYQRQVEGMWETKTRWTLIGPTSRVRIQIRLQGVSEGSQWPCKLSVYQQSSNQDDFVQVATTGKFEVGVSGCLLTAHVNFVQQDLYVVVVEADQAASGPYRLLVYADHALRLEAM